MPSDRLEQSILEAVSVTQTFGKVVALDGVSLEVGAGEFLTLLGPSGSGKTTLLQVIAGLHTPTSMKALRIAGEDVSNLPPHGRNVTTVFQHYALFPHISVGENVEYGLRVRHIPRAERTKVAREFLALVRLPHVYDRRIDQLSGGERQRVALARALAPRPAILLLDEPLGALDERLRLDMQVELHELQRTLGMTFVYVTHSQEEALTMSDRIVLMSHGQIVQEGDPRDLFERPVNRFAADFMGVENIFDGVVEEASNGVVALRVGSTVLRGRWRGRREVSRGIAASIAVRADKMRFGAPGLQHTDGANILPCQWLTTVYKGECTDHIAKSPFGVIKARHRDGATHDIQSNHVWWHAEDCYIVPAQ
jgi:ABC-type Fe3+/spermidine/putrescine transport system ATPase subunit